MPLSAPFYCVDVYLDVGSDTDIIYSTDGLTGVLYAVAFNCALVIWRLRLRNIIFALLVMLVICWFQHKS